MTSRAIFFEKVKISFAFLKTEFGFIETKETINGNAFFDIEFTLKELCVSISYENIEDHLEVIIFLLNNGEKPKYDDENRIINISKSSSMFSDNSNYRLEKENIVYFSKISTENTFERKLLNNAKKLRIYLSLNFRSDTLI